MLYCLQCSSYSRWFLLIHFQQKNDHFSLQNGFICCNLNRNTRHTIDWSRVFANAIRKPAIESVPEKIPQFPDEMLQSIKQITRYRVYAIKESTKMIDKRKPFQK